jgi:hypothetical protein|nr:MAG TPA: Protein of unknown function (DUF2800) [Caudoviricetes sp.]
MLFNRHINQEGLHAPFGASKSSWLRYSDDKIVEVYQNLKAAEIGTRLHEWAKQTIDLGIKQSRSKKTIYSYVNDAIGFNMSTEVVLYYSDRFFGTADAISFRDNILRIHDLKTGKRPVHIEQLEIYAALFCLEYKVKPIDIKIELRIYQNDEVLVHEPEPQEINNVMNKIVHVNKILEKLERSE